jgi:hypothetical protein
MSQENVEIVRQAIEAFGRSDFRLVAELCDDDLGALRSGVPVDREVGLVYRLRGGKLWRVHSYLEAKDALAAAGLPQPG